MRGYIDRISHIRHKASHVISAKGAYGSGDMGQILEGYSCCDLKFEQSKSIGSSGSINKVHHLTASTKQDSAKFGYGSWIGKENVILEKAMTGV